ncbi:MAG: cyclic nucleotide-binding domain-containing protein [Chloroflexales bacterium]|nr:cyclic nucleotide-binding domain-containing protein [Chloroflexales bacterium]
MCLGAIVVTLGAEYPPRSKERNVAIRFNTFQRAHDLERYTAGETIFAKGDAGNRMFVITAGTVTIEDEGLVIGTLGPGELIGELALIDAAPRSASAIARTDCALAPIDRSRFLFLVQQTPYFAVQVMQTMAEHMRAERARA